MHADAPRGYGSEDSHEADDNVPGKFVLASTWDSDGDGIPDFADGYDLRPPGPVAGTPPGTVSDPYGLDDYSEGVRLVPVLVDITGFFAEPDTVMLRAMYAASVASQP